MKILSVLLSIMVGSAMQRMYLETIYPLVVPSLNPMYYYLKRGNEE